MILIATLTYQTSFLMFSSRATLLRESIDGFGVRVLALCAESKPRITNAKAPRSPRHTASGHAPARAHAPNACKPP